MTVAHVGLRHIATERCTPTSDAKMRFSLNTEGVVAGRYRKW